MHKYISDKLLTNTFADSKNLEAWVTFGKQDFCLTVALHWKRIKTAKCLNLILS